MKVTQNCRASRVTELALGTQLQPPGLRSPLVSAQRKGWEPSCFLLTCPPVTNHAVCVQPHTPSGARR